MDKKYFSISEVSEILSITPNALRKLETRDDKISIKKIKTRRYYILKDIEYIAKKLGVDLNATDLICYNQIQKPKKSPKNDSPQLKFPIPEVKNKQKQISPQNPISSISQIEIEREDKFKILKTIATLSYHKHVLSRILNQ